MDLAAIRKDIKERNYVALPFPLSKQELNKAAENFLAFLTLPQEFKQRFYLQVHPTMRGSTAGYLLKKREAGDNDDKEYFHYHPIVEEAFKEVIAAHDPKVDAFLDSARQIHKAAAAALLELLKVFEPEFPGITARFTPTDRYPDFFLRFLKYDPQTPGAFLAKGHYDRGGLAIAIAESAPGLRIGKDLHTLQEVSHREGTVLFMPALHFPQITSPEFTSAWHDVVQRSEDLLNEKVARWAIVFFADVPGLDSPSLEETHTPKSYSEPLQSAQ